MKKTLLYLIAALAVLTACTDDNETTLQPKRKGIVASVENFVESSEANQLTRSSLNWAPEGGFNFTWNSGDKIVVFCDAEKGVVQNTQGAQNIYTIEERGDGTSQAYFDGGGFNIIKGKTYYSFTPMPLQYISDQTHIELSYAKQNQTENFSTAHLGAYDYQAACSNAANGYADLRFKHLGTVLRFRFGGPLVVGQKFKKFELITADNYDFQYERILDLTDDGSSAEEYNPALQLDHEPSISGTHSFALDLGEFDPASPRPRGILVDKTPGTLLTLFMMAPASTELVGKKLYGVLTKWDGDDNDANDVKYYAAWDGVEFIAGQYVSFGAYPTTTENLNIALSVEKEWQLGMTKNQTRAGDPGIDDKLTPPDHLYIYTCKDGHLIDLTDINITNIEDDWDDNGKRWTYNKNISVNIGTAATSGIKVFAIASKGEITTDKPVGWKVSESDGSAPSVVEGLTMKTTATEDILKNLYSYSYEIAAGDPPLINAVLYHVGAKMDIQWNSATQLSVTAPNNTVKIDNLPNTGLYIFKPTENTATGSWSPSRTITTGTCWNGRAVFYVPQMDTPTYSVTVGTSTQNVEFTSPKTNGFTSWFKGNITLP